MKLTKENVADMYRSGKLKVGDSLTNSKGETFTVTKIEQGQRFIGNATIPLGMMIDLVGSKKGKVFTVYA